MKKIINGKLYDTDTAKRIGSDTGNEGSFAYWHEELYVKRTGEYFLYGEGGAASRYAQQIEQNSWSGGEKIIPLSYGAARKWAEDHLDADRYQEVFGVIEEDDSKVALNVMLPRSLVERLRREAAEKGISLAARVEEALK